MPAKPNEEGIPKLRRRTPEGQSKRPAPPALRFPEDPPEAAEALVP